MFYWHLIVWIFMNFCFDKYQMIIGERKRMFTSHSEGTILGNYLILTQTVYITNTPAYLILPSINELECKCFCSNNKQCLAMTYRISDSTCLLHATDPCETRTWQDNFDWNFYINIKRLKYRLFEKPQQNQPLKRISASTLCGRSTTTFNSERRWLYAMKISGQAKMDFPGLNFQNAPNQVAPSPWFTLDTETIWNSILLQQWNSRAYFPKYFGFALIQNGLVREFLYFRLHKTTIENFFNKQHIPTSFCWNFKHSQTNFHQQFDQIGSFKRLLFVSINGNLSHTIPCDQHETFMYISPINRLDICSNEQNSQQTLRIMFSDQCQPVAHSKLARADALIALTSGDTTADI